MKNSSIIFTLAFIFLANASFAQIKLGTYYAFDTRFLGGINGLLNLDVKAVTDKGIVYLALNGTPEGEKEQSLLKVGEKQYANKENTRQLVVRADGDLEHYVIENGVIKEVYLFTQDKSAAKTKWKVVKKELGNKVNKQGENLAGNLLSYFYAKDKTIKLNEPYTGQEEIKNCY